MEGALQRSKEVSRLLYNKETAFKISRAFAQATSCLLGVLEEPSSSVLLVKPEVVLSSFGMISVGTLVRLYNGNNDHQSNLQSPQGIDDDLLLMMVSAKILNQDPETFYLFRTQQPLMQSLAGKLKNYSTNRKMVLQTEETRKQVEVVWSSLSHVLGYLSLRDAAYQGADTNTWMKKLYFYCVPQ